MYLESIAASWLQDQLSLLVVGGYLGHGGVLGRLAPHLGRGHDELARGGHLGLAHLGLHGVGLAPWGCHDRSGLPGGSLASSLHGSCCRVGVGYQLLRGWRNVGQLAC